MERGYFVILCGALALSAGELIVLKQKDALHCVTSDLSAVAWILPTSKFAPLVQEASKWINADTSNKTTEELNSTSTESLNVTHSANTLTEFQCDLLNNRCEGWTGGDIVLNTQIESSTGINFGPLRDYRWSNLRTYQTDGTNNNTEKITLKFESAKVLKFHVSVLAEENGYIFLSEGENPSKDRVYWIVLDGWKPQRVESVIRKCPRGANGSSYPCSEKRASHLSEILHNGKQWVDLDIKLTKYVWYNSKKKEQINGINMTITSENKILLHWNNQFYAFDVKYLFFRTYANKPGYWKFHQYNILKPQPGVSKLSSPEITVTKSQSLCLSIVYFSNAWAQINLLADGKLHHKQDLNPDKEWQVTRLNTELHADDKYKLQFVFNQGTHFYIGDIRNCDTKDVFVSTLKTSKTYKCVDLKSKASVEYKENNRFNMTSGNTGCLGDSFGQNCSLSCSAILLQRECRGVTACGHDYCSCLPGYITTFASAISGNVCMTECRRGSYGLQCRQKCGNCKENSTCDTKTGVCLLGCEERWKLPLCDIKLPMLASLSQDDVKVDTDHVTLNINDPIAEPNTEEATHLLLQYKETETEAWQNDTTPYPLPFNSSLILHSLKSNTQYEIRAVLLYNNQAYLGMQVPSVTVTTTCTILDQSEVRMIPGLNSITINWNVTRFSCPVCDYNISVDNEISQSYDTLPLVITGLQQNTVHSVTLKFKDDSLVVNKLIQTELTINSNWTYLLIFFIPILLLITSLIILLFYKIKRIKKTKPTVNIVSDLYENAIYNLDNYNEPSKLVFDFYNEHIYEDIDDSNKYYNVVKSGNIIEENKNYENQYEIMDNKAYYDNVNELNDKKLEAMISNSEYINV